MNIAEQAQRAYAPTQMPAQTPRSLEARLFSKVTSMLKRAATGQIGYAEKVKALHDNRQMWATFAANVTDDDNGLPPQLRAQLFYLAEFTEKHSREVLNGTAEIDALIDINSAVLRGLNGEGAT